MIKRVAFSAIVNLILLTNVDSQSIAINADGSLPNASAMLDIKSNSKGILIPRTSSSSRVAIVSPAKGLMIYDTTTSSFWFYNGSSWNQASTANSTWNLSGNAGIDPATQFIGTTD